MPIFQQGTLNTTALVVPDLYVQIVPPQNLVLAGAPTGIIGVVGSASWGPVGVPATVGTMQAYVSAFGAPVARKYDMGTHVATAIQQGASNFRCVRVTDGTDTAATSTINTSAFTATSIYTGTLGNNIQVTLARGTAANSWKVQIGLPGQAPEQFDNILGAGAAWAATTIYKAGQTVTNGANTYVCTTGGTSAGTGGPTGTGNAITDGSVTWNFQNTLGPATTAGTFWANVIAAINSGSGPTRGPSQFIVATGGAGTAAPTAATFVLASGTDGASGVTATSLIGVDTTPRKGMYSLRSTGCSIGVLADADDSTQWTTQAAFGISEGLYMITVSPSGDTIANAVAVKQAAGLDSYSVKHMFGDWIGWNDPYLGLTRLVSPQGFVAGKLGALSPERSTLNKPLFSIAYTQKTLSASAAAYSGAELGQLFGAGIEVISNPQPGGSFFGCRSGHNSSSNAAINGDNYTRMTNYLAATFNQPGGLGNYVGQVINATLFQRIKATCLAFLQNLLGQGILGSTDGSTPFSVVCDITNNPSIRTQLGYVECDINVQYQAINEKFIVNVQGGQTVTISRQTTQAGQVIN